MNPKKLNKLIHEPKQYFIDGHKNRKKRWLKGLQQYRPFFIDNLHHVDKLHEVNLPIAGYYKILHGIFKGMSYRKGADEAIKKVISLKPSAKNYHQLGLFLKSEKLWWRAVNSFEKSIELATQPKFSTHKEYALCLEEMNRFDASSEAWKKAGTLADLNSEQHYRYGYVLEKNDSSDKAKIQYQKAIKLDDINNSQHLGIGIFHEKRGLWNTARIAYAKTANKKTENAEVLYKLGLSNDRCYNWQAAEIALRDAITLDTTQAHYFYRLGFVLERQEKWDDASIAYQQAIDRKEDFTPYWFYRLGYVLEKQGKHKEANQAFLETRVLRDAHGVLETDYHKNKRLQKNINYTEYYERFKLDERTVLYESYHGSSIACNPYAIFKVILKDDKFQDYRHIWVINEKEKIPNKLKGHQNIIFIGRDCDLYMRYLAKAKYLINNVTFPEYFIRKKEQAYLNTWHGTPIKSLGKDIKDDFMAHKNVTRNFLQTSHLVQPNPHTSHILLDRYDVQTLYCGQVVETGYPRQDLMINISTEQKQKLCESLQIPKKKKVVLYAPTWRGEHGKATFDTTRLETDLKTISSNDDIHLLFRGHHMMESLLGDIDINAQVVPPDIDTNSLLSIVDILITDYSSICFDFMALKRSIIYYTYDRETYEKERGLYFPIEELGGELCSNLTALTLALDKVVKTPKINDKQSKATQKYCLYDDGLATQRVVDLFFYNKPVQTTVKLPHKKSLLFYGGPFIPNGISTSYINLINHIDTKKYSIALAIEPQLLSSRPERLEQLSRIKNEISIIGRVGHMATTLEEKWVMNKFGAQRSLSTKEMYQIHQKSYVREFYRNFGRGTQFQSLINFEGYNAFWVSLFSTKISSTKTSVSYLHNDMNGEWKLRFPYLEKNFRQYSSFNKLVSVSEKTKELNYQNLSKPFEISDEKFIYADNLQDSNNIINQANQPLEKQEDAALFNNSKVFINIARLSPEKDQEKLIKAFQKVSQNHPEAKLINLGSGPLQKHLEDLIVELQLQKKVFLLGQKSNPYPYLKHADCFILSSNHEGQPMTLFEAMILEMPIIATDIVGNRSVLKGRSGLLVENSKEGLISGMKTFLDGKYNTQDKFDDKQYNQSALDMFYSKVLSEKVT